MDEKKELKGEEIEKVSGGSKTPMPLKAYGGPPIRPDFIDMPVMKYGGPAIRPIKPSPKAYGGPFIRPDSINHHVVKYGGPMVKPPKKPEEVLGPSDPSKPESEK